MPLTFLGGLLLFYVYEGVLSGNGVCYLMGLQVLRRLLLFRFLAYAHKWAY
jgi:hypothetical protein